MTGRAPAWGLIFDGHQPAAITKGKPACWSWGYVLRGQSSPGGWIRCDCVRRPVTR